MHLTVVSCNLKPASRSHRLSEALVRAITAEGATCEHLDLATVVLPLCDGGPCYNDPEVKRVTALLAASDGIALCTPIYNYDASAATKNLVELTGSAWEDKVAGFLCMAGGKFSYMSILGLANSLMLDFRTIVVPRFVYATGDDFTGGEITNPEITRRIAQLGSAMVRLCRATRA